MSGRAQVFDVVVVGGGAVGLFAALALLREGLRVTVLERSPQLPSHSRAIGIHPPALALADALGAGAQMRQRGVAVHEGHACTRDATLGTVSFGCLPGPHPFVLTLPQNQTEAILEDALERHGSGILQRGMACTAVQRLRDGAGFDGATLTCSGPEGEGVLRARFVIAADGHASGIRNALGLGVRRRRYCDAFLMGDFPDETGWGADARIFLADDGWVESFPLPEGLRRWVASTDDERATADASRLAALVAKRTGQTLRAASCLMSSAFGIIQQRARRFVAGPVVLVGDAAHVISPIGGQGMNLGWLGAWDLAEVLGRIFRGEVDQGPALARWERRRQRQARAAMRRAAFNMALGRPSPVPALRNAAVRTLLRPPFHDVLARTFTMQGL